MNKATKTFKCDPWVAAAIHDEAHTRDISDGEYIRRILTVALIEAGHNPADYIETRNSR